MRTYAPQPKSSWRSSLSDRARQSPSSASTSTRGSLSLREQTSTQNQQQTASPPARPWGTITGNVARTLAARKSSLARGMTVQTKLTIGEPGDAYEREADRIAQNAVTLINTPAIQHTLTGETLQRDSESAQANPTPQLHRPTRGKPASPALTASIQQAKRSGRPLTPALQQSFGAAIGSDFSGVRIHTNSQADRLNQSLSARAFTTGQDIFFRRGTFSPNTRSGQKLLAHELTHVVQQTGTLQPCIQRYYIHSDSGKNRRVSDDDAMAVYQESSIGGKEAYATTELIKEVNDNLPFEGSIISLEAGTKRKTIKDIIFGSSKTLANIVPTNTKTKKTGSSMKLWADCGRSAKAVSGIGSDPRALYRKGGKETTTPSITDNEWMEIQKVRIFVDLFGDKLSGVKSTMIQKLKEYFTKKEAWSKEKVESTKETLSKEMSALATQLDVLARTEYEKLSSEAKDTFDKTAGINMYADPQLGQAFHISTGGKRHPKLAKGEDTWNFHWAGVIMKSGSDTMTLENYSVGIYDKENTDWAFQMYGVGKKGQSFHEEHRDVHKQHGIAPTTMVAKGRNKFF